MFHCDSEFSAAAHIPTMRLAIAFTALQPHSSWLITHILMTFPARPSARQPSSGLFSLRRVTFVCCVCRENGGARLPLARTLRCLAARWHQHQREYNLYNMSPCISHSCLCERLTGLALAQTICLDSGSSLISWSSIDKFHVCLIIKCTQYNTKRTHTWPSGWNALHRRNCIHQIRYTGVLATTMK